MESIEMTWVFLNLILIQMICCQIEDQMEVRAHKLYKDLNCYYPKISSMTKLRDNKYFVSTNGQKFWLISDSEEATDKNSRHLNTITTEWHKIDASLYFGLNVECSHQFRDKLVLVNFNEKTQRNEVIVGSLAHWNWTLMVWSDFEVFNLAANQIDWKRSIDAIASVDETLFLFQDQIQLRIDCNSKKDKWIYEISTNFRQIPLSGPFEAAYCDDKQEQIYPLYAIRGKSSFICFVKENNNEWPTCEEFPLTESSMTPKPSCFVANDPNAELWASLSVQIVILSVSVVVLIVFSLLYLWNLWQHSSDEPIIGDKQNVSVKNKTNKPDIKSQQKPDISERKPKKNEKVDETKEKSPKT